MGGKFTVYAEGKRCIAFIKGVLKKAEEIYVGDMVEIETADKKFYIITKLYERKNLLIRPYFANTDILLIFLASIPQPDFILIDKLIVNCNMNDITPIICCNKNDLDNNFYDKIISEYSNVAKVYTLSSIKNNIPNELKEEIKNKNVVLAGQSATGKSTFLNALLNLNLQTGEVSRIERGKNTTRHIEIFYNDDYIIADTCGFSAMELNLDANKLYLYYDDFMKYQGKCKYKTCVHIDEYENECAIKQNINLNNISYERYLRYVIIYNELLFNKRF